jgi:AcrR family transcriptional regulator
MSAVAHTERRRRSDGERSRQAILEEAARLATVEGLDGLSLGRLADAVGMSKSGLFAHFKSKEELQLATIETADEIYERVVVEPAFRADPGVDRLRAFGDRFIAHVRDSVFPGGCFFASVAAEFDTRPGPVRDRALQIVSRWITLLRVEAAAAQAAGDLDSSIEAHQLAFELHAYLLLGNAQFLAGEDPAALDRAWRAYEWRLEAARPTRPARRRSAGT